MKSLPEYFSSSFHLTNFWTKFILAEQMPLIQEH